MVASSAENDIKVLDKLKNEYFNMAKPYQLKVKTELISQNSSEYNSFYMVDSLFVGKVLIKQIYSEQPKIDHRSIPLKYDLKLKRSVATIKYSLSGVFPASFVAVAVGNVNTFLMLLLKVFGLIISTNNYKFDRSESFKQNNFNKIYSI